MNTEALDLSILGPAYLAGLLVAATHVPLGQEVLRRGIIFIDLAVAQIAGFGVIAAQAFGWPTRGWGVQIVAAAAALAGAGTLAWTERRWPAVQEAIIGTAFILAASAGILVLARHPHGAEYWKDLLAGQILWVHPRTLVPVACLYGVLLALWFGLRARLRHAGFYVVFALAVTASVQLVGVYLVFATLIIPALAVRRLGERARLGIGYLVAVLGYAVGLAGSALFDLPAGVLVVWTLALVGVAVAGLRCA